MQTTEWALLATTLFRPLGSDLRDHWSIEAKGFCDQKGAAGTFWPGGDFVRV